MPNETVLPNWVRKVAPSGQYDPNLLEACADVTPRRELEPETMTFVGVIGRPWEQIDASDELAVAQSGVTAQVTHNFVSPYPTISYARSRVRQYFSRVFVPLSREEAEREFERADSIRELSVGSVTYHLRRPLRAQVLRSEKAGWTFSTEEFAPRYVGTGETIASAQHEFARKMHVAFQSLVRLRPFQMNEKQLSDWRLIEGLIDVERYWHSVPLVLWEVGFISNCSDAGRDVVWLDGHRTECVKDEQAPPDFVVFGQGQWFEALVEREPDSYRLRKVQFARQTSPPREMTQGEFRAWLKNLPSGESLPEAESDWRSL